MYPSAHLQHYSIWPCVKHARCVLNTALWISSHSFLDAKRQTYSHLTEATFLARRESEEQDKPRSLPTLYRWDNMVLAGPGRGQRRPSERNERELMACRAAARPSSIKNTSKPPKCHSHVPKCFERQSFISVEIL